MTPARPWVQICNERLLPRFGVDRLLMLAGRFLVKNGFEVSYLCLRHDPAAIDPGRERLQVLDIPPGLDVRRAELHVTNIVMSSWMARKPDILLIGGWPFFELAARSGAVSVPSVFIDAGAVPHDRLTGHDLWPQLEIRRLRQAFLPYVGSILPISDFIRDSQTLADRGGATGVRTVLLGSDHLDMQPAPAGTALDQVRAHRANGHKLLLNLGRFEPQGYKNSPAFFDLIALAEQNGAPEAPVTGLVLGDPSEVGVPPHLRNVICLGKPSDAELLAIMHEADIGISMSLWEGFNLPIVEMQRIAKPVLAFNIGAHPEVIAHPWQLCRDTPDMARRVKAILGNDPAFSRIVQPAIAGFKTRLPWAETLDHWMAEIRVLLPPPAAQLTQARRLLLIDVSNSARDPANSGVIRVTRQLTARLKDDERFDVVFAHWDAERSCYTVIPPDSQLSSFGGPPDALGPIARAVRPDHALDQLYFGRDPRSAAPAIAMLPEVILDGSIYTRTQWLRYRGFMISTVLYDLIPEYHREYCDPGVVSGFRTYLQMTLKADHCISISANSLSDFVRYAREHHAVLPSSLEAVWLPAQLGDLPRVASFIPPDATEIRILCVSTIEPRKNHASLLEAFQMLVQRRPDLRLRLVLVGNSYVGAQHLVDAIHQAQQDGIPVTWLGIVTDEELADQYRQARFTVYPSLVEGFGIPIVESLWMGRPCICSSSGVMAELAAGGGCRTTHVQSPGALSETMERLTTDDALHRQLTDEALARPLTTWKDYARLVGNALSQLADLTQPRAKPIPPSERGYLDALLNMESDAF